MVFVKMNSAIQRSLEEHSESCSPILQEWFLKYRKTAGGRPTASGDADEHRRAESVEELGLMPLQHLRELSLTAKIPLRVLTQTPLSSSQSSATRPDDVSPASSSVPLRFIVCPSLLPHNPHRAEMRKRIAAIEAMVEREEYDQLVANVTKKFPGDTMQDARKESLSSFSSDIGVALDVRLMSLAGGVVGYYLCYVRGMSMEERIIGAAVGAVAMLFVDGILLILRIAKSDSAESGMKKSKEKSLSRVPASTHAKTH